MNHFKEFKCCKKYWGIHDDDISNFDETECQINVLLGNKVIISVDYTTAYHLNLDNCELIMIIITLNYD